MATPEIPRKIQLLVDSSETALASPLANTISQMITKTTTVRMAVARLELTFSTPILAKTAVSAANSAENNAAT